MTYQEVQRAEAEEIMGAGPGLSESTKDEIDHDKKDDHHSSATEQKHRFEAEREAAGLGEASKNIVSADSIAKNAMKDTKNVSEEPWGEDEQLERDNIVQEELYIHAKVLIVDDKTVVCGSSNINDRVSFNIIIRFSIWQLAV